MSNVKDTDRPVTKLNNEIIAVTKMICKELSSKKREINYWIKFC